MFHTPYEKNRLDLSAIFLSLTRRVGSFNHHKFVKSVLKWTAFLGILIYLLSKLSSIGWTSIMQSLPTSPFFYMLSVAFVFLPIITERAVFPMAAKTKSSPIFKSFIRKHVINKAVMNYAGEGYFLQQVSKLERFDLARATIVIKDLALVRTFAANFWVLCLVFGAVIFGNSDILSKITRVSPILAIVLSVICIGFCLGSILFFRRLTRLEFSVAGKIACLYLLRSFLAAAVLILQWNIVLPGVSLGIWVLFLIVFFIAKKSPIGGDLVFVSVALTLPGLGGNSADVAAMLLMTAAVVQILYFLGFVFTSELTEPSPSIPSAF